MKISEALVEYGNSRLIRYFSITADNDGKGNDFKIWQKGSHTVAIYSKSFFDQKLNYLHDNPVRKGYVERPEHWMHSRARNYARGDDSIIAVDLIG